MSNALISGGYTTADPTIELKQLSLVKKKLILSGLPFHPLSLWEVPLEWMPVSVQQAYCDRWISRILLPEQSWQILWDLMVFDMCSVIPTGWACPLQKLERFKANPDQRYREMRSKLQAKGIFVQHTPEQELQERVRIAKATVPRATTEMGHTPYYFTQEYLGSAQGQIDQQEEDEWELGEEPSFRLGTQKHMCFSRKAAASRGLVVDVQEAQEHLEPDAPGMAVDAPAPGEEQVAVIIETQDEEEGGRNSIMLALDAFLHGPVAEVPDKVREIQELCEEQSVSVRPTEAGGEMPTCTLMSNMYYRQDGEGNEYAIPHTLLRYDGPMLTEEESRVNAEYMLNAQQVANVAARLPNCDNIVGPVAFKRKGFFTYETKE